MSAWDIDPAGVGGVLSKTSSVARGFETHVQTIGSAMETAAPNTSSALVAAALGAFAEELRPQVESVLDLTGSALEGCSRAVQAYGQGDLEMAAQAQANASSVSRPDMPGGHGARAR